MEQISCVVQMLTDTQQKSELCTELSKAWNSHPDVQNGNFSTHSFITLHVKSVNHPRSFNNFNLVFFITCLQNEKDLLFPL